MKSATAHVTVKTLTSGSRQCPSRLHREQSARLCTRTTPLYHGADRRPARSYDIGARPTQHYCVCWRLFDPVSLTNWKELQ